MTGIKKKSVFLRRHFEMIGSLIWHFAEVVEW